jgi:hypothetical protein
MKKKYGVLRTDSEEIDGIICCVIKNPEDRMFVATKKQCKEFVARMQDLYKDSTYTIFKMKFKENV